MISVHDDSAVTTGGQQATPAKLPAKHVAYRPETRPFHLLRMFISLLHFFFECPFRQHSPRASHSICKFGRGRDIAGALSAKKDGVRATCFLIPTDHASCNSDCCWVLSWSVCLRTPWTGNIVKESMHLQGSLRFFVCGTCDDSWNSWRVMIVPICQ